jgi:hypothetical protein
MDFKKQTELFKEISGCAAVLYGIGFMIVRARLNALGVWSSLPIVDSKYLSEGWLFVCDGVYSLLRYVLVSGPLLALGLLGRYIARRYFADRTIFSIATPPWLGVALQSTTVLVISFVLGYFGLPGLHVAGLMLPDASLSESAGEIQYELVLFGTVLTAIAYIWLTRVPRAHAAFRHLLVAILVASIVVLLPVNYVLARRIRYFPVAEIQVDTDKEEVLLVDESGSQLVVYERGERAFHILPRDAVKRIRIIGGVTFSNPAQFVSKTLTSTSTVRAAPPLATVDDGDAGPPR